MNLFLGLAANYSRADRLRHTFAFGTRKDYRALTAFLARKYGTTDNKVALTKNGRSALTLAIKSAIGKGNKVAVNAFTCYAVVEAVKAASCTPIFVDIDPKTLHYNAETLKTALKKHPDIKGIIIQNSLGIAVDIEAIQKVTTKHGLAIIEDLAHCAGINYPNGKEAGTIGDATILSFGKGKSIDTISGGALVLRERSLRMPARKLDKQKLSDTLRARWYPFFGVTTRALKRVKLDKIWLGGLLALHFVEKSADSKLDTTRRLTYWQAKLALRQLERLSSGPVKPIREFALVRDRDEVLKKLESAGYHFNEIWYDKPVAPVRYYDKVHFPEKDCPNAVMVANSIVNLPSYYLKAELNGARKIIKEHKI